MRWLAGMSRAMKKVWKPAWGNPLFLVFPFVMVVFNFVFTAREIRNWVDEIAYNSSVFAMELVTESGPSYLESCDDYADMIAMWLDHSEESFAASVVRIVFPRLSVRRRFERILADLEIASDNPEAKLAISITAEELVQFSKGVIQFSGGPKVWPNPERTPPDSHSRMLKAIAESEVLLRKLQDAPTLEAAHRLCNANRQTMLLMMLARGNRLDTTETERFYACVERSADLISQVAHMELRPEISQHLKGYVTSEQFRIKILDAMRINDITAVHKLLREAIEVAFTERGSMLGIDQPADWERDTEAPP